MTVPLFPDGFDPRQVGAMHRRPRLPTSRATGAAFFAEIVHGTISDRSSPPSRRVAAPAPKARPDLQRSGRRGAPCRRACALWQRTGGASTGSPADRAGCFVGKEGTFLRAIQTICRALGCVPHGIVSVNLAASKETISAGSQSRNSQDQQKLAHQKNSSGMHP